jgi:maltose/maltodextrin transport system substrate-binding protein/arabinogalactan oligomer/maltooligosaccharide transport system substrate-binding protein
MKQRSLWFAMLLLVAALLAACTAPAAEVEETAEPTEAAEPTEEVTAEPTEEVTAEPTEEVTAEPTEAATEEADMVELLVWADETRSPLIEQLSPIAEQYGVRLTVQQMGFGDIRDQLAVAGPAGEGPDLFIGAHDWLGYLVENGLVAEMDLAGKEDQFLPAAIDAFTYNGTLYGVPYATENIAFLCNTDTLGDREVPATWEDVMALAEELEAESNGEVTAWTIQTNDPYHLFPLMSAYGGYVFGYDEATGYDPSDVGIDSEGTIQAAQFLQTMVEAGHLEAGVDYDVMHTLFEQGSVACIGTGPWALERINTAEVNYTVNPFPAGDEAAGRPLTGRSGLHGQRVQRNASPRRSWRSRGDRKSSCRRWRMS